MNYITIRICSLQAVDISAARSGILLRFVSMQVVVIDHNFIGIGARDIEICLFSNSDPSMQDPSITAIFASTAPLFIRKHIKWQRNYLTIAIT